MAICVNTVTRLGYRLTWFDGYDVNGQTFFNTVFVKDTSIAWVNFAGMDATGYQNTFNQCSTTSYYCNELVEVTTDGESVQLADIVERAATARGDMSISPSVTGRVMVIRSVAMFVRSMPGELW